MTLANRMSRQKWLLDEVIATGGLDWDQLRRANTLYAVGPTAADDYQRIEDSVTRFDEFGPEFAYAADQRLERAKRAACEGNALTAAENYFVAAVFYGWAQWPLHREGDVRNIRWNDAKVEAYSQFAEAMNRRVERVQLEMPGGPLPGWLHLPNVGQAPYPTMILIPGMDTFKELQVALYGDKFLERGFAVLAVDGPGQSEALVNGLKLTPENFAEAGQRWLDFIDGRDDLDSKRIGIYGRSFGSYAATVVAAAHADRLAAVAGALVVHEPGLHTLMNESAPSFKARFMYMTGYTNENEFDDFVRGFDLFPHVKRISCPYLAVAGEFDQLSPVEYTIELIRRMPAPADLVVYEGERHAIGRSPAAKNGPHWHALIADWFLKTMNSDGSKQTKTYRFVRRDGAVEDMSPDVANQEYEERIGGASRD